MRTLILGGGRFQGYRAAEMLVEAGHEVTVFNRSERPVLGGRHVRGERSQVAQLLRNWDFDCVIDNIAYRPEEIEALFPLMEGRVGQYVFISSFVVYDYSSSTLFPVREEEADLTLDDGYEYHNGKRRCEAFLLREGHRVPWTALRFYNIDGPDDPSNRRGFFIDRVRDGGGLLVPSEWGRPFQLLWRDDAARSAVLAAGNPRAHRQVINIAGEEILGLPEYLKRIAAVLNVEPPYIGGLPFDEIVRFAGFPYKIPMPNFPVLDLSRARDLLGYRSTPVDQWLPGTVQWWLESGLTSRFWENRPLELAAIRRIRELL